MKLRVNERCRKNKVSEEGVKGESGSTEREEKEKEKWRERERKVGERGSERREFNSPIPDQNQSSLSPTDANSQHASGYMPIHDGRPHWCIAVKQYDRPLARHLPQESLK